ncbi:MAG: PepSY domain-containing protein [Gammaproteobacteria bacterium]
MAINTAFRLPSKATGSLHGSHAITRPGKQVGRFKLRPLWLRVHRCLALTVGFLFVLIGLTGSLKVFCRELDELLNPELAREHTLGASRHSYDEILQIVRVPIRGRQDRGRSYLPTTRAACCTWGIIGREDRRLKV